MTRANPLIPAQNAGEFSPHLIARSDLTKYRTAGSIIVNLYPIVEGALVRRPGSRFAWEAKDSTKFTRVDRFEYRTDQAYILEMGPQYFRFGRYQARIAVLSTTASITNGTFPTDLSGWTDLDTGTGVSQHNASGYMELSGGSAGVGWREQAVASVPNGQRHTLSFRVRALAGDVVKLRIGTTSGGTQIINDVSYATGYHCVSFVATATTIYIGFRNDVNKFIGVDDVSLIGGGAAAPVEIASPYLETDLEKVRGPQSIDARYFFHGSYAPRALQRYDHDSWSLEEVDFQDGPWLEVNTGTTTLTPGATTGYGVTLTASSTAGINDDRGFLSTDVGRLVRLSNPASGTDWGYARISGYTSATVVTVDIKRRFLTTNATTTWRLGAWSDTTGWPAVGGFHQQRMMTARTTKQPQTFWGSETTGFSKNTFKYSPDSPTSAATPVWDGTVQDDDAFTWTISSDKVEMIQWLSAGRSDLVIGTAGGEWVPKAAGLTLTPTDIDVVKHTNYGSTQLPPVRIAQYVLFLQRQLRRIRILGFQFQADSYVGENAMRLSRHIGIGGIRDMEYQQEPNSLLWAVRNDGQLLAFTFGPDEEVSGWSRNILGGSYSGGIAVAESVTVIPGENGAGQVASSADRHEVWVAVKRTIGGSTKRYFEVLERDFEGPIRADYSSDAAWKSAMRTAQKSAYYLDSMITYNGTPAEVITGLSHLEGQTVGVLADGAIHDDCVVTGGQITLQSAASIVQIGLRYRHIYQSMKMDYGAEAGTAQGRVKKIYGVTLMLHECLTAALGPTLDVVEDFDFRTVEDNTGEAVPLFVGEAFKEFDGDWAKDPRFVLASDDPAPFTVLAFQPAIRTHELT